MSVNPVQESILCPRTEDTRFWSPMKSQDIVILFKLISLELQEGCSTQDVVIFMLLQS